MGHGDVVGVKSNGKSSIYVCAINLSNSKLGLENFYRSTSFIKSPLLRNTHLSFVRTSSISYRFRSSLSTSGGRIQ